MKAEFDALHESLGNTVSYYYDLYIVLLFSLVETGEIIGIMEEGSAQLWQLLSSVYHENSHTNTKEQPVLCSTTTVVTL